MFSGQSSVVWFTKKKERFFLLPKDHYNADMAEGTLMLYTIDNRQLSVDPDALAPYEITLDEAKAALEAQLGDVLGQLRSNFINVVHTCLDSHKPSTHESPDELVEHADAIETVANWVQHFSTRAEQRLRTKAQAMRERATNKGRQD